MGFGDIFGKSWRDYWNNFGAVFWLVLLFVAIPSFIVSLVILNMGFDFSNVTRVDFWQVFSGFMMVMVPLVIIQSLIGMLAYAGIIVSSLKKKKFGFFEAVSNAANNYFRFLIFSVVITIFLLGLFILLIIPGIIFSVYWIFSAYVLFDQKKGIIDSLRISKGIVKGNWWRVFGYIILFSLIFLGIIIIFSLIGMIINLVAGFSIGSIGNVLVNEMINIILNLFLFPLAIFFGKNFYLVMKAEKRRS